VSETRFEGNPCQKCESTIRYVKNGECVACARARAARRSLPKGARAVSETRFEGNTCEKCGSTIRYIKSGRCVACHIAQSNGWKAAHREAQRKFWRAWVIAHPEARRKVRRKVSRRRRARLNGAHADNTHGLWDERLQEHDGNCIYCAERGSLTLDHFAPLAKGGSHTLLNFVPACRRCNSAKGTKVIEPTARIRSFLEGSQAFLDARALAAEAKLPSTHGDAGTISSSIPGVQQRP
jgi:5-methylcytosine-specific restriction endonuclease McrA